MPTGTLVHTRLSDALRTNFAALPWSARGPLLVVGNPPWVTSSELGALGSLNVPVKRNLKGLRGLEAKTGHANFDLTEYVFIQLLEHLQDQQPTIALLCKTSVARKIIRYVHKRQMPVTKSAIYRIDAGHWFGASVDACLLSVDLGTTPGDYRVEVFDSPAAVVPSAVMGLSGEHVIPDLRTYEAVRFVDGKSQIRWRQGIKHDVASVLELTESAEGLRNGLGEPVRVESDFLFPLAKSSDLASARTVTRRWLVVPQMRLGAETTTLATRAPNLAAYLEAHSDAFDRRKSSIYSRAPRFALFGVGDYSFAPYKVAISGLHKRPSFRVLQPVEGKPVVLDDTCYFAALPSLETAVALAGLLSTGVARAFLSAIVFTDSKRPITVSGVLSRLDLEVLERSAADSELVELVGSILQSTDQTAPDAFAIREALQSVIRGKVEEDSLMQSVLAI